MVFNRLCSAYLFLGASLSLYFFSNTLGLSGFLNYLVPASFTVVLLLYFIGVGVYGFVKPLSETSKNLIISCLIMQGIQFSAFGFKFKNYFGPYIGFEISSKSTSVIDFFLRLFDMHFGNGYFNNNDQYSFGANLFPFLLWILLDYFERRRLNKEELVKGLP